ncbi:MAG: ABC transporter permease, partial [Alphaproteobacteria bacterium]|nr:ABC transporter permease [Alphaproteobacteria bacterium]
MTTPSTAAPQHTRWFGRLLFAPIGVIYLLFLLAPISFFLALSVAKYHPNELFILTPTLENYRRLLLDGFYLAVLGRTLKIAALVTSFSLLIGYPLALFLARTRSAWRGVLMFLVIAPLMSGVIVRTYGWIVLMGSEGLINAVLKSLGIVERSIQIMNTQTAVVVALVHILMPYMVFPIFSALASMDRNVERAASTLGARGWRVFLEVTLPLSRQGIVMGCALVFTLTAGAVVTPALMGPRGA